MSLNPDAFVRAGILDFMRDTVAGGALELLSAGDAVLAVFQLDASAGSVSGTTWTPVYASATVQGTAAAGDGTQATKAQIKDGGGVVRFGGLTVGVGAGDIQLVNRWISQGQNVTLTSSTINYPAV